MKIFCIVAQFRYSQPTYVVGESNGPAQPAIELVFGTLTFDIDVDVATVAGGSATGICSVTLNIHGNNLRTKTAHLQLV